MVNLKEQVGIKAAEFVKDGMIVGLGTGSTAYYFVAELGRRIKEEGLQITAVTTSSVTYDQAESLGIPLKAIDDVEVVDVNLFRHFEQKGYHPAFRLADDQRFVTDQGNFIIDLDLKVIEDAEALANELDHTVGVVEHGLFLNMISKVIVGTPDGPVIIEK